MTCMLEINYRLTSHEKYKNDDFFVLVVVVVGGGGKECDSYSK